MKKCLLVLFSVLMIAALLHGCGADTDSPDDPSAQSADTAEAGGMMYNELLEWLVELSKYNIIGADIVELAPDLDPSKVSSATACTLVREILTLL